MGLVGNDYFIFYKKKQKQEDKRREKKRREKKRKEKKRKEKKRKEKKRKEKKRKEKKRKEKKRKETNIVVHGLLREPEATLITTSPLQRKLSQRRCNSLQSRVDHLYICLVCRWVNLSHQQ